MKLCVFCQLVSKSPHSFLYEDEDIFIIPDKHSQSSYHVLIIPKKHIRTFVEIEDSLLMTILIHARRLVTEHNLSGFRLIHNGYTSAQIDHFHLHVVGNLSKNMTLHTY